MIEKIEEKEQWKIAYVSPAGRNTYEISSLGNMRLNGKEFHCKLGDDEYYGFARRFFHREFARLFHPDFWPECDVHHIDFDSKNNLMANLQSLTHEAHAEIHARNMSNETKKKLSMAKSGENHPMYGKHLSNETKRKISKSMTGEKNPNVKLTERDVIEIKMLFKLGFDDEYIQAQFPQVSLCTINDIRKGRSWKHVIV